MINPLAGARFTRLTSFEGSELGAAISPDGQFVAFVSDHDGSPDVFLGQIGVSEFRNVTQGRHEVDVQGPRTFLRQVGFTGDGSEIWLAGDQAPGLSPTEWIPGGRRIRVVPLLGGPMRNFLGEDVAHVDWSPDGESLVYYEMPGDPISVAGRDGTNRRLTIPSGEVAHQHRHSDRWGGAEVGSGPYGQQARGFDAEPTPGKRSSLSVIRTTPQEGSPVVLFSETRLGPDETPAPRTPTGNPSSCW